MPISESLPNVNLTPVILRTFWGIYSRRERTRNLILGRSESFAETYMMSFQVGARSLGGTGFFQLGLCTPLRTMLNVSGYILSNAVWYHWLKKSITKATTKKLVSDPFTMFKCLYCWLCTNICTLRFILQRCHWVSPKKWGIWKKWRKKQKGIWQLLIRNYQNADLTAANKPMTRLWAVAKKEKEFATKIKGSTFMWQRERVSLKSYTRDTELYRQNFTELFQSQLLIVVLQNNFSYTFHKTPSKATAIESFQKHPATQKALQCYYWWRGASQLFSWEFSTLSRRELFQDARSEFY